ncbi:PREDICTED: cubilin-like isoform X3 [Cercocebus atys]|uniref:cubilin-like isoform X3 n=1 Tax=Cercocebus atys TaxID=9531 RepID=UPI0005F49E64|nr:PREDICTED: cubilin-like isoform X3 [Cercocebus atys]
MTMTWIAPLLSQPPQNHTISLFFHLFGIKNSVECRNDFLEDVQGNVCFYGDRGSFTSPGYPALTIQETVSRTISHYDGPNVSSPSYGPYCRGEIFEEMMTDSLFL